MSRVTEYDVALAVLKIASANPSGICSLNQARNEIPNYLQLSADDLADSETRPGEPMWHQQIRNIQSHHAAEGNFIYDGLLEHVPGGGYRITEKGLKFLQK